MSNFRFLFPWHGVRHPPRLSDFFTEAQWCLSTRGNLSLADHSLVAPQFYISQERVSSIFTYHQHLDTIEQNGLSRARSSRTTAPFQHFQFSKENLFVPSIPSGATRFLWSSPSLFYWATVSTKTTTTNCYPPTYVGNNIRWVATVFWKR